MTSVTLIVGAFMAGMGLGSMLGGRLAGKLRNPVLCFALVELIIGIFGIFSPRLLIAAGQLSAGAPYWAVFVLSFLLLIIPTFLMGMTLPLLVQAIITKTENAGRIIGVLYGLNTLGAAVGAVVAGFFLIGRIGLNGSAVFAATLYGLVGFWALLLVKKNTGWEVQEQTFASETRVPPAERMGWNYKSVLIASFMIGCIGLGYEMLWFRMLNIINKSTAYSFPTILFVYLSGLALGSYYWGKRADKVRNPGALFWKIEITVGIVAGVSLLTALIFLTMPSVQVWLKEAIVTFQRPGPVFGNINGETIFFRKLVWRELAIYLAPVLLLIFPAGLIMGGGLPILDRLAIDTPGVAGRRVGDVHLSNILGSVFGTLLVSFVLLPGIGSELTLKALLALCLIFPLLHYANLPLSERRKFLGHISNWLPVLLVMVIILLPGRGELYRTIYETGTGMTALTMETGDSVLTLSLSPKGGKPKLLWLGGETNSFFPSNGAYERWAMVCAGAAKPERILIIGLGGGNSARFLSMLPGVRKITVVELLPELGPFLAKHLDSVRTLYKDSRFQYIADDGRRYLYAHPGETYDMILTDPLRQYTIGHDSLYSREALELYRNHLSPGGVFCLWRDEDHLVTKTIAQVFPYMDVFYNFSVASNNPINYDITYMLIGRDNYMNAAFADIDSFFRENTEPVSVLREFRADRRDVLTNEVNTPVITDLTPWLEYYYLSRHPSGKKYLPVNPLPLKFTARVKPWVSDNR